jgi:hypothetical protein
MRTARQTILLDCDVLGARRQWQLNSHDRDVSGALATCARELFVEEAIRHQGLMNVSLKKDNHTK